MMFDDLFNFVVVGVFLSAVTSSVIPKSPLNTRPIDRPLSDEHHFEDDEHNIEFDHDAFLGKDEAKSFDQLTPAESARRLGIIYEKIDEDKNGLVTEVELGKWIRHVQKKQVEKEANTQWLEHLASQHLESSSELRWSDYLRRTYGSTDEELEAENHDDPERLENDNKDAVARDKRRWDLADIDGNGQLTKEEFTYFVHPEEAVHTRNVVIEETLEDIDKDHDGFISLKEYIDDTVDGEDGEEFDPAWIADEEEDFREELDKNGDGKLDREEIEAWVMPNDYYSLVEEAKHLISEADSDKDGFLTKSEVVEKYELFVGSQATDYGEVLSRHDEF